MKALITEQFHECLVRSLLELGIECTVNEEINTQGVLDIIHEYDIIVVNSKILLDQKLLEKTTRLKIIARVGSGLDIIDLDYCKKHQIDVISSPEGNANAVAEHTLAFILSSFNNLYKAQTELLNQTWVREENRGVELDGKVVAIIGFGNTGRKFAEKLKGFNVKILVYDIVEKISSQENLFFVNLDTIYEEADVVSMHLPLNKETLYIVNQDFFQKFNKTIYFVNTSRGKICCTEALIDAIENNKVAKAMLDVFEDEPINISEKMKSLMNQNKLFLSPHIAGWTIESKFKLSQIIVEKIKKRMN